MLSKNSIALLISALGDAKAGNEMALAIANGAKLSSRTFAFLVDAMADAAVASDIQAAIIGTKALSVRDLQFMVNAFSSPALAAAVASNVIGGVAPAALKVIPNIIPLPPPIIVPPPPVQVALATFLPIAGSYVGAQLVTVSSLTAGASFYYTTNGSTPTISSTPYVGAINVGVSETLKVLGVKSGLTDSAIASAAYTISAPAQVATQVLFTTQPSSSAQNVVFATQPIITIKDSLNAVVTSGPDSTALVTINLFSGTGSLLGTASMNAVAGIANFAGKGLKISMYGDKILRATKASTLSSGTLFGFSSNLNISNGLAPVNLLSAANYRILSQAGISGGAGSMVTGDIAVSPIDHTAITGFSLILDGGGTFATSASVVGQVFAADYSAPTPANLTSAVSAKNAAYTDAAGRTLPDFNNLASGTLSGITLVPGLYKWSTAVSITGDITFAGGPNDVWIMQCASTLDLAAAKQILLSGGALPQNIFWQVAGAVSILANANFKGILLGATSIAIGNAAAVHGRLYAGTAVTLLSNNVSA